MTAFSLPWYAAIHVTAGKSAAQFIRQEWFVPTAVLTSVVYLMCDKYFGMTIWPATLIAFFVGFFFRVAALWYAWEEPLPRGIPASVMGEVKPVVTLKKRSQDGYDPS